MVTRSHAVKRLPVSISAFTKYLRRMALLLVVAMLCFVGGNQQDVYAQSSPVACALTPSVASGQGFNVAGLGFNVAGLGFNVAGLGFNVAGLGFNVAGLGLNPVDVANEIRNATITAQWLTDLKPTFEGGQGFGTTKTAILVIDDQTHGNQVLAIFNMLKTVVNMSNVKIEFLDISDGATNYRTDMIATRIKNKVSELESQGYKHFVLNMSFGLIPCEDTIVIDGQTYNFNFNNAINGVKSGPPPQQKVAPVLVCVIDKGGGNYIARFGYNNPNDYTVKIPAGSNNKLTGKFWDSTVPGDVPTFFEAGNQQPVFEVYFEGKHGKTLAWKLDGSTATASANSPKCGGHLPNPNKAIKPILECVADNGNGTYTARYGYQSDNSAPTVLPVDSGYGGYSIPGVHGTYHYTSRNYFEPKPQDRGQTNIFLPGLHKNVFSVVFNGSDLVWKLKGPDGQIRSAKANKNSPACFTDTGYGMDDWLNDALGIPNDKVDDALKDLMVQSPSVDDSLQALRKLLQDYLKRSANSNGAFQAVAVASSGNFQPWLGDAPLAPARWSEVISVGATVGNTGSKWRFSHKANVLAPGVSHPNGNNSVLAGTSFAAPYVSMYLGQFATYPNACNFKVNGSPSVPLKQPGVLGEKQVTPGNVNDFVNAFTCVKPLLPEKCYATSVVSYVQGKRKDGKPIDVARRDPNKALGAPQNDDTENHFTLGFLFDNKNKIKDLGGEIVLKFDRPILNSTGKDFRVWETSFGDKNKPWQVYKEAVKVFASADGSNWTYIGTTSDKDEAYDLGSLSVARYIKLIDVTKSYHFGNESDGFDVDAVEGFLCDGAGSSSRLVTEDPNGGVGGLGMRGVMPVDPAPQGNTGAIEVPSSSTSGEIPLPPPPGN